MRQNSLRAGPGLCCSTPHLLPGARPCQADKRLVWKNLDHVTMRGPQSQQGRAEMKNHPFYSALWEAGRGTGLGGGQGRGGA